MYTTQAQMETRFGTSTLVQVSDRGQIGGGVTVDAAVIAAAIQRADALIDGYLSARYQLPLATTPEIIVDISQRIAIYYAHSNVAGDKFTVDYKQALKELVDIAKGISSLQVAGVDVAGSGSSGVQTNQQERPLTINSLKGYI